MKKKRARTKRKSAAAQAPKAAAQAVQAVGGYAHPIAGKAPYPRADGGDAPARQTPLDEVKGGLHRLAFGSTTDAVELLFFEETPPPSKLAGLDLFHVSEVKRGKNGVEVKLFDRLKALEALARLAEAEGAGDGALPFYKAILGSAGGGENTSEGEGYDD